MMVEIVVAAVAVAVAVAATAATAAVVVAVMLSLLVDSLPSTTAYCLGEQCLRARCPRSPS